MILVPGMGKNVRFVGIEVGNSKPMPQIDGLVFRFWFLDFKITNKNLWPV